MKNNEQLTQLTKDLDKYILQLESRKSEYMNCLSSFFGGHSKTDKLAAAKALRSCIDKPLTVLTLIPHWNVLHQGHDLPPLWNTYKTINPNAYKAIQEECNARYASSNSGYDSDTSERIQGRCSKD